MLTAFILLHIPPGMLLSDTLTVGGDTPAHSYLAGLMQRNLASGRLTGWGQGWWCGFPAFQFYFVLPYAEMDLLLWAKNHGVAPAEAAPTLDLTPEQVERVYRDIDRKRATTRPLQLPPLLIKDVPEIVKT